jgi:hypothetical protein
MKAIIFFGCKLKEPESKTTTNGLTLKSVIILIEIGVIVVLIFAIAFTTKSKKGSLFCCIFYENLSSILAKI